MKFYYFNSGAWLLNAILWLTNARHLEGAIPWAITSLVIAAILFYVGRNTDTYYYR